MTAKDVNIEELKNLSKKSHTAEVVLNNLASRERLRHFTDLTRFKTVLINEGKKIVDEDFMSLFQALERLGIGSVIYGRTTKPDRFEWFYSLKDVAKVATNQPAEPLEKLNVIKMPIKRKLKELVSNIPSPVTVAETHNGHSTHVFVQLRPRVCLDLLLPSDMSDDEMNLVSQAIRKSIRH